MMKIVMQKPRPEEFRSAGAYLDMLKVFENIKQGNECCPRCSGTGNAEILGRRDCIFCFGTGAAKYSRSTAGHLQRIFDL